MAVTLKDAACLPLSAAGLFGSFLQQRSKQRSKQICKILSLLCSDASPDQLKPKVHSGGVVVTGSEYVDPNGVKQLKSWRLR